MKYIVFVFILFSLFSCKEEAEKEIHLFDIIEAQQKKDSLAPISITELTWMEGHWMDSTTFPGQKIVEEWSLKADTLIGKRGTIKDGETSFSQTSKIVIAKDKPVYLLEPNGSAFISFRLNEFTENQVSFINIANASPQEISYSKSNKKLELIVSSLTPAGKRVFKNQFVTH